MSSSIIEWNHDPGGKVRLPVDPTIQHTALFSECGQFRQVLQRTWDSKGNVIIFIGMNPSVADMHVDDPTCRKEFRWAQTWGYGSYVKLNVMDYRSTNPRALLDPMLVPQTPANLSAIQEYTAQADAIVAAWGKIHKSLEKYQQNVENILASLDKPIYCLGTNQDGSPRHPLYLSNQTELQPYFLRR